MATTRKKTVAKKPEKVKAEKPGRVYVSVSQVTLDRLDALAEKYGVTRASLISLILGQYCASMEEVYKAVPSALTQVANSQGQGKLL